MATRADCADPLPHDWYRARTRLAVGRFLEWGPRRLSSGTSLLSWPCRLLARALQGQPVMHHHLLVTQVPSSAPDCYLQIHAQTLHGISHALTYQPAIRRHTIIDTGRKR